ncbi:MAG TPA: 16S rRNA (cytosine(1402)-N(4))-methyltransferase RsmH [Rhodothermales bacterium]|nr:16S rRNA (cytosine(1402)-N(4))-methyltransferase RsmH [Rhodothermales bacterium]
MEAAGPSLPYATAYHAPVLCNAVVEGLVTDPAGLYIDATLGGGGHTAALLDRLAPQGRVLGIDRDADALAAATKRLADAAKARRFRTVRGSFADLDLLLDKAGVGVIDGLLLDLGVSSHQFDAARRGFSHRYDAPLDMRMDQRAPTTAADIVNTWKEADLVRLFFEAGEEPRARRIVAALVAARPVTTTERLASLVRSAVPTLEEAKSLARVFQALRIAVNDELDALEAVLETAVQRVRPGGRVAVLAYHSLEDRRVKRFFRYGNFEGRPHRDVFGNLIAPFREITRQPVVPDEAEVAANPRARSARLRIAERAA